MLPTAFRSEPVLLCPYLANWAEGLTLTLGIDSAVTRSLGGAEAREAHGATLRAQMQCSLFLRDEESELFRSALRNLADKRVLMPLWPMARRLCDGMVLYTDNTGAILTTATGALLTTGEVARNAPPPIVTGLWLTAEFSADSGLRTLDSGSWEVHETPLPASGALANSQTAIRVPLMLGYFDKLVEPVALTPRLLTAKLKFVDSAPATFAPRVEPPPADSLAPDGKPLFPFAPNWAGAVSAGGAQYDIKREQIGYGREPATTYYPQLAARHMQAVFTTFSWDDVARLAAFFAARKGSVEAFAVRHATDGLLLARFAKPSIDIDFISGRVADTKIGFLELPHEAAPPPGETPGVTLGAMPPPAMLYRFTRQYPGGTAVDRYTSYERDINAAGELFLARMIDSGDIVDSLEPEKTKVKLSSRAFDGNPLMLFSPNRLEVPLIVEVLECNPDPAGLAPPPRLLFIGRVAKPEIKGPLINAEATHLLADLQRDVPQKLVQGDCNNELFGPSCGVPQADWTFLGEVARYDGQVLTLGNFRRANAAALPPIGMGWFAFGRVWFGAGDKFQTRTINDSTAPAADGTLKLTVSQPFDIEPSGVISLIPGCAGDSEACRAFGNYPRFGGFPCAPVGNPSLKAVKDEPKQGKK